MDLLPALELAGCKVTVMGLGRFGGGLGAVRFLAARGAHVTVTDLLTAEELAEPLAQLTDCPVEAFHLGGHVEEDFVDADLIVVNPAVPPTSPFLARAREACVLLTSEMSLFWQFNRGRTIGVTGSNGKSTTAAMTHAILQAAGIPSRLGGNIGTSLLPEIDDIGPEEWSVVELSSFQLNDLDRLPASPNISVVTNFTPNHLDWHGSLADYRRCKQSILRWQTPDDVAVVNLDDADVRAWPTFGRRLGFGCRDAGCDGIFERGPEHVLRLDGSQRRFPMREWISLPGRHNLSNAMAAACAAVAAGSDLEAVRRGLKSYRSLPHRLEFVAEVQGRRFYNDSLATTPESAVVGLEAFQQPVVLLAGGYDKQIDLTPLAQAIVRRAKAAALIGQTADLLACLLEEHADEADEPPTRECDSFEGAFAWAVSQSEPGDVVLLSPGCASYDWFRNYAERGRRFVELVDDYRRSSET
ncbi:MAG TPA: UDP-N-acetylmuramoyl-L-alanine--D-glutamate ligase [Planctomycetaceae bacterium]|nr:UDP-N-acetylmuramoyl-L-alanine--D-glutamate ligase [Planctomycetaceae bacterium]